MHMTRSEHIAENVVRVLAAPAVGLFAAALTAILLGVLVTPLATPTSDLLLWYGCTAVVQFAVGFAFVFMGLLVAPKAWRLGVAFGLLGLGIVISFYMASYFSSDLRYEVRVWPLIPRIAGGVLAATIQAWRADSARAQTFPAPNGGAAAPSSEHDASEGPPPGS
jgi:hypothetical protein